MGPPARGLLVTFWSLSLPCCRHGSPSETRVELRHDVPRFAMECADMKRGAADEIALRRSKVAALILGGATERAIGAALDLSAGTVHRDVSAIRKAWQREQRDAVELASILQLERLNDMIFALWPAVKRGDVG